MCDRLLNVLKRFTFENGTFVVWMKKASRDANFETFGMSRHVCASLQLHGSLEQLFKIGCSARAWVGLMTNVGGGNLDQARHVFWLHTMG
jgi:hypothetical protein